MINVVTDDLKLCFCGKIDSWVEACPVEDHNQVLKDKSRFKKEGSPFPEAEAGLIALPRMLYVLITLNSMPKFMSISDPTPPSILMEPSVGK